MNHEEVPDSGILANLVRIELPDLLEVDRACQKLRSIAAAIEVCDEVDAAVSDRDGDLHTPPGEKLRNKELSAAEFRNQIVTH